jgi:hypothetical protein
MRVILAFLAMEVSFGIAPATAVLTFPRGGLLPSFGTKLFMLAQASIRVPSTEKCSLERSWRTETVKQSASMAYDTIAENTRRTVAAMADSSNSLGRRTLATSGPLATLSGR